VGPALVHADAFRIEGVDELDDLDLEASLDESVTVVEWGEGLAEGLTEDRLDVRLDRLKGDGTSDGAAALAAAGPRGYIADATLDAEARVVSVRAHGSRWVGARLRSTLLADGMR
jgi:tRNA threonylcarbamoyladenosine biosynthesis protein TsaE